MQVSLKVSMANPVQKGRKKNSERDSFKSRPMAHEHKFSLSGSPRMFCLFLETISMDT